HGHPRRDGRRHLRAHRPPGRRADRRGHGWWGDRHRPRTRARHFRRRCPMRSELRLLPLFIRARTVLSPQGILMAVAFAACSALFLTVAGGLWAFLQWDTSGDVTGTLASYKILAGIATALLLVPAMTLGQAAANLAARSETD